MILELISSRRYTSEAQSKLPIFEWEYYLGR